MTMQNTFHPCPKPVKSGRPGVQRRKDIRKRDKAFQIEGERHWCECGLSPSLAGHYAEQTTSHHILRRRDIAHRWDRENTIRLCYAHHSLLHQLGETEFFKRYYFNPCAPGKNANAATGTSTPGQP